MSQEHTQQELASVAPERVQQALASNQGSTITERGVESAPKRGNTELLLSIRGLQSACAAALAAKKRTPHKQTAQTKEAPKAPEDKQVQGEVTAETAQDQVVETTQEPAVAETPQGEATAETAQEEQSTQEPETPVAAAPEVKPAAKKPGPKPKAAAAPTGEAK